jgi:hypothetical protein
MSAESLPEVVARVGALPMPVGSEPRTLDVVEEELTGANLSLYEEELENARLRLALASAQRGRRELRARIAELEATSVPDETEYAIRMPGSNDVWPRKEFRIGHWERLLAGGTLLQRVIRRGPWAEVPKECPGFEGNPVSPDLCAGCGEPRDSHEEAVHDPDSTTPAFPDLTKPKRQETP